MTINFIWLVLLEVDAILVVKDRICCGVYYRANMYLHIDSLLSLWSTIMPLGGQLPLVAAGIYKASNPSFPLNSERDYRL